ncbi:MAG: nickel-responsive transcriptional regulator NikR [Bacteroidota bacterium]
MGTLVRFGVSIEKSLVERFDRLLDASGYANRSEALRDLMRSRLVQEEVSDPRASVLGVFSLVYDHHRRELERHLKEIQHRAHHRIISATHVHVDHDTCLEVILLRGKAGEIRSLADALAGLKGVKHTSLSLTSVRGL